MSKRDHHVTYFAFHGNPGTKKDWDLVKNELDAKFELIALDPYQDDWRKTFAEHHGKFSLIAHSMGCLVALQAAKEFGGKIDRMLFINPYVVTERPLSPVAKTLISLPVVGDVLLKTSHKKASEAFIHAVFAPLKPTKAPSFESWKVAAQNKIQWQDQLAKIHDLPVPTLVL